MEEKYQFGAIPPTQIRVSIFENAYGVNPQDTTLAEVFESIRSIRYAHRVKRLRDILAVDEKEYHEKKKSLPAFIVSGTAKGRKVPDTHSGLLQIDLDKLGADMPRMQERLKADPHVYFFYVSPSGRGFKAGIVIDGARHEQSFEAARAYFRSEHNCTIDESCKDRLRLCFVSHDPDLWINPQAIPLPIPDKLPQETPSHENSASCLILNSCDTAYLHNTTDAIKANLESSKVVMEGLEKEKPVLAKLYRVLVEPRFQAQAHKRNEFLTEALPFLYRAVAENVALELVGVFYDCNRALFNSTREQHMDEAKKMLGYVAVTYVATLSESERPLLEMLSNAERDVFRICRDLAQLPEPPSPLGTFFMSFEHLGARCGIFPMQAQRIMRRLEGVGFLTLTRKGLRRQTGVAGRSGEYLWLLKP